MVAEQMCNDQSDEKIMSVDLRHWTFVALTAELLCILSVLGRVQTKLCQCNNLANQDGSKFQSSLLVAMFTIGYGSR